MAAKKAKLQDQFLIDAQELPDSSQLFQGVAIFVNGYSGKDKNTVCTATEWGSTHNSAIPFTYGSLLVNLMCKLKLSGKHS